MHYTEMTILWCITTWKKQPGGTSYAASIEPFQRGRMEGGAWKVLTSHYADQDKWEAEIKSQEQLSPYQSLERTKYFFT